MEHAHQQHFPHDDIRSSLQSLFEQLGQEGLNQEFILCEIVECTKAVFLSDGYLARARNGEVDPMRDLRTNTNLTAEERKDFAEAIDAASKSPKVQSLLIEGKLTIRVLGSAWRQAKAKLAPEVTPKQRDAFLRDLALGVSEAQEAARAAGEVLLDAELRQIVKQTYLKRSHRQKKAIKVAKSEKYGAQVHESEDKLRLTTPQGALDDVREHITKLKPHYDGLVGNPQASACLETMESPESTDIPVNFPDDPKARHDHDKEAEGLLLTHALRTGLKVLSGEANIQAQSEEQPTLRIGALPDGTFVAYGMQELEAIVGKWQFWPLEGGGIGLPASALEKLRDAGFSLTIVPLSEEEAGKAASTDYVPGARPAIEQITDGEVTTRILRLPCSEGIGTFMEIQSSDGIIMRQVLTPEGDATSTTTDGTQAPAA